MKVFTSVPAGHYAMLHKFEKKIHFFKVDRPTEGRWKGYTFVSEQTGDNYRPVKNRQEREVILNAILRDVPGCVELYDKTLKVCGICHRSLTVKESQDRGIGPVCAANLGI